jgi:hypothetical protein
MHRTWEKQRRTPAAVPKLTVLHSDRVPVTVEWARITDDNGQQFVACEVTSIADELLTRLEMTVRAAWCIAHPFGDRSRECLRRGTADELSAVANQT